MKKYFKLVPAALALMAMTSCSNDLFTNEAPTAQVPQEGDLVVENETLEWDADKASTRSYLSADLKVRMYTTNDAIKAFDDELNKYDIYAFSWNDPSAETAGVFRRHNTATNLDGEPRWAIYPDVDGQEGHWNYNKETNNTLVTLSSTLQGEYYPDGTYQKSDTKFENPLYKDILPRWGEVTATEGGSALNTSLKYLTGVLRLQLNGAPDYANAATVEVYDGTTPLKINGEFTTTLAINDVMQTAEFAAGDAPLTGEDKIYVGIPASTDLKGVDAMKSVVFIPLPTTNHSVDIVVNYYKGTFNADGSIIKASLVTPLKTEKFGNKTIKRAKVYGHTTALNFATDATNASGVSDAIELEEVAEDKDLILNANKPITITATDNIIYIPNKNCQSITVNLSNGITNTSGAPLIVKYKDVEGEGKYKNPVTIVTGAAVAGDIDVQLDETPFVLAQQNGAFFVTSTIDANALTLAGALNTATTAYTESPALVLSDNVKTLNIADQATINAVTVNTNYPKLETINVIGNGQVLGAINATGIATEINADGESRVALGGAVTTKGDINISEKAEWAGALTSSAGNINIDVAYTAPATNAQNITATLGNVSINSEDNKLTVSGAVNAGKDVALSGKTGVTGAITAGQDFSVIEESSADIVSVKRDATIDIDGEAEAITTSLTYTGNGKLNLFSGYVNTVVDGGKTVKLYHGEKAAFTAIGTLTSTGKFEAQNVSKWNGKQIGGAFAATYALETSGSNVWTASQLGYQLTTAANFTLKSDIDLDNKNWAGIAPAAAYIINGDYHTISNINLVNANPTSKFAGFIARNIAATTIDNLSFDAVKTTINQLQTPTILAGVGAVIGNAGAAVTLTNVDVKLAAGYFGSMNGNKNVTANNIGGVIGDVTGAATLTGVTVDATNAILAGHHSMGGFIGNAQNTVWINAHGYVDPTSGDWVEKNSSVTGLTKMQVTLLNLGTNGNDPKQGMTGYYIGSANLANAITIEGADDVNPTFTVGGLVDLSKAFTVSGGLPATMNLYSAGAQSLIGQSGFVAGAGTTTINGSVYGVHVTTSASTPNNVLYKVTVTTYQP